MLVDHGDGKDESKAVSFSDEGSVKPLHSSGADTNAFADRHVRPWLDLSIARLELEEFDLAIGDGKGCTRIANDAEDPGTAENDIALTIVHSDEEVRGKEGAQCADALTILPDLLDLVGGEEGFDLAAVEEAAYRIFTLGHGVKSEPAKGRLRGRAEKRRRADLFGSGMGERRHGRFLIAERGFAEMT